MAFSKLLIALFFVFAIVATTLQPSDARLQGFEDEAEQTKAATTADGGSQGRPSFPGLPLPQIPGFTLPLPQIPGFPNFPPLFRFPFPPLFGPRPSAPGAPPSRPLPNLPHFPPIAGSPGAPPFHLPGLPTTPAPPPPAECLTPLTGMAMCMDYLTNLTVTTPPSGCCDGLKSVIAKAPICLCHGMNGGMSKLAPKPIDPIRMLILPARCGTMIPIQTFFSCATTPLPPLKPPTSPAAPTPPTSPASPTSPVSPPSAPAVPPLTHPSSPAPASPPV
ncbi:vegetative cell wall protein gp1 [Brachypodium distachyon]|uniref:Bifunctional inhibitor/plant lipid transfer protein/seed storage helical domain-containing protein n=1 Tax=Brachypodium distachyon TaxID=15368 RepID=A0A0Q3GYA5_BRADI|nr:vegetative cell wall protein gp1 [Brachypodium distachyon]KQK15493.1 hypothetical protein BRADI_1g23240v3 [Brachypodium distachyon]|eukprot:XP_014753093.1 vegetative cell wall protein gp1 [Brachypodium distachyon]